MQHVDDRIELSAGGLRELVRGALATDIRVHRRARRARQIPNDEVPSDDDEPSDEEIDDFLSQNPLLDAETVEQLIIPGLLGHDSKTARATPDWLEEFKDRVARWTISDSWLTANLPWLTDFVRDQESVLWLPVYAGDPTWIHRAPSCLALAADLLRTGRLLHELHWRQLEELVGAVLESDGWHVEVTRPTRDGGFDVVAIRTDPTLGALKSIWQAKKYGPKNSVKLHEVRELSAVRDEQHATKAVIVTTSRLTRDAVAWVQRDRYRLAYKDHDALRDWIERQIPCRPRESRG